MTPNLSTVNELLTEIHQCLNHFNNETDINEKLKAGIDLGTSSIVLVVLTDRNVPVLCLSEEAQVIKDGLVVNFSETIQIVKRLKTKAESWLKRPILTVSGAIPPQTVGKNKSAVRHVLEAADLDVFQVFDEPEAAAKLLGVGNGAVVDIGGGTTGISIFENSKACYSADEPTGGHHMSLVLAGAYQVELAKSEKLKRNPDLHEQNFRLLRPVVEKMAVITKDFLKDYGKPVDKLYLVGGAVMLPEFEAVFEDIIGIKTCKPIFPRYVTPTGIALLSKIF